MDRERVVAKGLRVAVQGFATLPKNEPVGYLNSAIARSADRHVVRAGGFLASGTIPT